MNKYYTNAVPESKRRTLVVPNTGSLTPGKWGGSAAPPMFEFKIPQISPGSVTPKGFFETYGLNMPRFAPSTDVPEVTEPEVTEPILNNSMFSWGATDENGTLQSGLFKGMNNSAAQGIMGAIGSVGGGILAQGNSNKVGNAISTIGKAIPGPWGLAIQGVGDVINAGFGHKTNAKNVAKVQGVIDSMNSFKSNAGSLDALQANMASAPVGMSFSNKFIGSDGWFSNHIAKKANKLRGQLAEGAAYVNNALNNNLNSIKLDTAQNLEAHYAAAGGPLFMTGKGVLSPFGYRFDEGGGLNSPLHSYGADWTNGITFINNGGTHEGNSNSGVQMGVDEQGIPNLVEEGEVIWNNYVFSNRLKVPKRVKNIYKLGGPMGMTFADAVRKIQKESEERPNDPISKRGLEDWLIKLALAQEEERRKEHMKDQIMSAYGGVIRKFEDGGMMKEAEKLKKDLRKFVNSKLMENLPGSLADLPFPSMLSEAPYPKVSPERYDSVPTLRVPKELERDSFTRDNYPRNAYLEDWFSKENDYNNDVLEKAAEFNRITNNNNFLNDPFLPNRSFAYGGNMYGLGSEIEQWYNNLSDEEVQKILDDILKVNPKFNKTKHGTKKALLEFANNGVPGDAYRGIERAYNTWKAQNVDGTDFERWFKNISDDEYKQYVSDNIDVSKYKTRQEVLDYLNKNTSSSDYKTVMNGFTSWRSTLGDEGKWGIKPMSKDLDDIVVSEGKSDWKNPAYDSPSRLWLPSKVDGAMSYYDFLGTLTPDENPEEGFRTFNPNGKYGVRAGGLTAPDVDDLVEYLRDPANANNAFSHMSYNQYLDYLKPFLDEANKTPEGKVISRRTNPLEYLRFSPIAGSLFGVLSDLMGWSNKPDLRFANAIGEATKGIKPITGEYVGDYMTYKPTDVWQYFNQLAANTAATRRAMTDIAGGNRGTAMAGLVNLDNNSLTQLGNARLAADKQNFDMLSAVKKFNRETNEFNATQAQNAKMADAENLKVRLNAISQQNALAQAAYDRASAGRSHNFSQLFTNLGNLGIDTANRDDMIWLNETGALKGPYTPWGQRYTAACGGKIRTKKKRRGFTI